MPKDSGSAVLLCPTCNQAMHQLGCRVSDLPFFWCPRCGTIKPCDAQYDQTVVPMLVTVLRQLQECIAWPKAR